MRYQSLFVFLQGAHALAIARLSAPPPEVNTVCRTVSRDDDIQKRNWRDWKEPKTWYTTITVSCPTCDRPTSGETTSTSFDSSSSLTVTTVITTTETSTITSTSTTSSTASASVDTETSSDISTTSTRTTSTETSTFTPSFAPVTDTLPGASLEPQAEVGLRTNKKAGGQGLIQPQVVWYPARYPNNTAPLEYSDEWEENPFEDYGYHIKDVEEEVSCDVYSTIFECARPSSTSTTSGSSTSQSQTPATPSTLTSTITTVSVVTITSVESEITTPASTTTLTTNGTSTLLQTVIAEQTEFPQCGAANQASYVNNAPIYDVVDPTGTDVTATIALGSKDVESCCIACAKDETCGAYFFQIIEGFEGLCFFLSRVDGTCPVANPFSLSAVVDESQAGQQAQAVVGNGKCGVYNSAITTSLTTSTTETVSSTSFAEVATTPTTLAITTSTVPTTMTAFVVASR